MPGLLPSGIGACCPRGVCISTPVETIVREEITELLVNLFLVGHGSPEGVVVGAIRGQLYTDLDTGTKYTFLGTVGQATGWV